MGGELHFSGFVCQPHSNPDPHLWWQDFSLLLVLGECLSQGKFHDLLSGGKEEGRAPPAAAVSQVSCLQNNQHAKAMCLGWHVLNLFIHKTLWQSSWSSPLPQARSQGITQHTSRIPCQCPQAPSACSEFAAAWSAVSSSPSSTLCLSAWGLLAMGAPSAQSSLEVLGA